MVSNRHKTPRLATRNTSKRQVPSPLQPKNTTPEEINIKIYDGKTIKSFDNL
jgi:hypothetical protein